MPSEHWGTGVGLGVGEAVGLGLGVALRVGAGVGARAGVGVGLAADAAVASDTNGGGGGTAAGGSPAGGVSAAVREALGVGFARGVGVERGEAEAPDAEGAPTAPRTPPAIGGGADSRATGRPRPAISCDAPKASAAPSSTTAAVTSPVRKTRTMGRSGARRKRREGGIAARAVSIAASASRAATRLRQPSQTDA